MSSAKLTLIGGYNFFKLSDSDLFEHLTVPEGIDKETLINNILLRGGEFEIIYGDYYFIKTMIETWSKKWERTFEKWVLALSIDFNPLENYDRYEEWNDSANATGHDTSSNSGDVLKDVSAFNSSALVTDSRDSSSMSGEANTSTESNSTRIGHTHGNIGVTTSTQMLEDYLRVQEWNLYEHITDVFLKEFVIPLY